MVRERSTDARGERSGGGDRARDDSGMSWYGAKFAAMVSLSADAGDDAEWFLPPGLQALLCLGGGKWSARIGAHMWGEAVGAEGATGQ